MRKMLNILKIIGKTMSNIIVCTILSIVYFIVIGPYRLFVKFNRVTIQRRYKYQRTDHNKMF
ncbi:MAG TPA: hypothetical protein DD424_07685 [Porphyromonadaceae bacterium]|nr:hypothetical protein [Porphyromonadaceae bacterium]